MEQYGHGKYHIYLTLKWMKPQNACPISCIEIDETTKEASHISSIEMDEITKKYHIILH